MVVCWRLKQISDSVLSPEDKEILAKALARCRTGTCQLMVQQVRIAWACAGGVQSQELVVLPMVVQRTTATCLKQAFDEAVPLLSWSKLQALALNCQILLVCLTKDSASSNKKMVRILLQGCPGNMWVLDISCSVHLLALPPRTLAASTGLPQPAPRKFWEVIVSL